MDREKVKEIINLLLRNVFEVINFHGLASFYRKFIKNFSSIYGIIVETIKESKNPYKWTIVVNRNFRLWKRKIIEQFVVASTHFIEFFQVETSAIGTTI